ncbi:zinc finger A20 and AN1 domain-containing stress-associated protein 4-like [Gastrolobium bilobum]|uniref:zinc finger A20 and AN1 domain-containing stress-associated protein 4-like n=1 Tax=Gastrolobium bilobum TaxID=150636 RepID=UPI002AAF757F|nr:zinc finger A20 and AN1 domain-containing stress-associated protein 4-like [Gastrolobium bilobum]
MAEEHRCQAPEGHRLCANNCGFFGSSATMNLCSKCYGDICLKEQEQASTKSTIETALSSSSSSSSSAAVSSPPPSLSTSSPSPSPLIVDSVESLPPPPALVASSSVSVGSVGSVSVSSVQPNRCATCRKRVGLTGFKCRCGVTFCGSHRYPEKHACSFDFKTVGREEIARANPVIKAEKLERI